MGSDPVYLHLHTFVAHTLALRILIEGIKSHDLVTNAFIIFFDFKKAFESIDRGKILEILAVLVYHLP